MAFNEADVNRKEDGKFGDKVGAKPDIALEDTSFARELGDVLSNPKEFTTVEVWDTARKARQKGHQDGVSNLSSILADRGEDVTEARLDYEHKPGVYGGYEIKAYKRVKIGPEGGAFTASIYRDGKKVMTAENDGWGGQNVYTDLSDPKMPRRHVGAEVDRFNEFAKQALGDDVEPADAWMNFHEWATTIDKGAAKNNWPRDKVVEANLKAEMEGPEWSRPSEREQAILRDPSILADINID